MTREEAKTRLIAMKAKFEMLLSMRGLEMSDVFDVAIEALSAEPCEDAVSRQAVDTLVDELARAISDERCCMSRGRSTATIMQDILDLPPVTPKQKMGRWIPVSERLPEPYGQVLRTVKSIGWNGTFSIYVDIGTVCPIDTDVIAWMPLPVPMIPEPYKAESEETE